MEYHNELVTRTPEGFLLEELKDNIASSHRRSLLTTRVNYFWCMSFTR